MDFSHIQSPIFLVVILVCLAASAIAAIFLWRISRVLICSLSVLRRDGLKSLINRVYNILLEEGLPGLWKRIERNTAEATAYTLKDFDPSKKTLLVVSHEASRTGAPILCLNIVGHLKKHYNIVTLLLNGGPLLNDFQEESAMVLNLAGMSFGINRKIRKFLKNVHIEGALINSVVCYSALPSLIRLPIPIVFLVHEFATYMRPARAMEDVVCCSSEIVFSSALTFQDAKRQMPAWVPGSHVHILPQGRCLMSGPDDLDKIERAFYPEKQAPDTKIILGAGSIQIRKGVDLFILCAQQIIRHNKNVRFVWIGHGYNPKDDMSYSIYLAEQIERSGLKDYFEVVGEIGNLDQAYQKADLFLLTSRLDPLPNVGIDAICYGLPIVCFDGASGIANVLIEEGLADACVAPHLDTAIMADKAVHILGDTAYAKDLSRRLADTGKQRFDMGTYLSNIEKILEKSFSTMPEAEKDIEIVTASGQFDLDYWRESVKDDAGARTRLDLNQSIRMFVRGCQSGLVIGSPNADFDAKAYAEHAGIPEEEAFLHFIKSGAFRK